MTISRFELGLFHKQKKPTAETCLKTMRSMAKVQATSLDLACAAEGGRGVLPASTEDPRVEVYGHVTVDRAEASAHARAPGFDGTHKIARPLGERVPDGTAACVHHHSDGRH